ncbi:tRNA adenosine(34) deaminase TadA [Moraxella sp. Tifton1]|uniref:tRNA adenosine(34) deaminase TadA n=1 Tax=Moraxella oculi TaxID=2940516 RepID=UPI002011438A|nr:tRNA adenosine(34) deaminase TadA [Moraxella sp. Tifton1]MCL1622651.1 tRNA adenosine(34) deaminase TadA [Moraxella sp. Tifton1]
MCEYYDHFDQQKIQTDEDFLKHPSNDLFCAKNNFLKRVNQVFIKSDEEFDERDGHFMSIALDMARQGAKLGEVPVGAVIVQNDQLISQAFNRPISTKNPIAHAEMNAIQQACVYFDNYRLPKDCTLYVSLEPCTMCLGAIVHSRLDRVVFAAMEPKSGSVISQENFANKAYFNHYLTIEGGLMAKQSGQLLQDFFKQRRRAKQSKNTH